MFAYEATLFYQIKKNESLVCQKSAGLKVNKTNKIWPKIKLSKNKNQQIIKLNKNNSETQNQQQISQAKKNISKHMKLNIYIRICLNKNIYIYIYISKGVYMFQYINVCIYVQTGIYIYIYIYMDPPCSRRPEAALS